MLCIALCPEAKIFQRQFQTPKMREIQGKDGKTRLEPVLAPILNPDGTPVIDRATGKPKMKPVMETITQDMLMKDPQRIFREEKFTITVEKGSGDVTFTYGVPRMITDPDLRHFLCGGMDGLLQQATNFAGIVQLPMQIDQVGAIVGQITGEGDDTEDLQSSIKTAMAKARDLSRQRVYMQIRMVHEKLKKQYEQNKEQGLGTYTPSPAEFLCAYALQADEARDAHERKEVTDKFAALMAETMFK